MPEESNAPDGRVYFEDADQISTVFIHGHHRSQKDIEICAAADITHGGPEWQKHIGNKQQRRNLANQLTHPPPHGGSSLRAARWQIAKDKRLPIPVSVPTIQSGLKVGASVPALRSNPSKISERH